MWTCLCVLQQALGSWGAGGRSGAAARLGSQGATSASWERRLEEDWLHGQPQPQYQHHQRHPSQWHLWRQHHAAAGQRWEMITDGMFYRRCGKKLTILVFDSVFFYLRGKERHDSTKWPRPRLVHLMSLLLFILTDSWKMFFFFLRWHLE